MGGEKGAGATPRENVIVSDNSVFTHAFTGKETNQISIEKGD